MNYHLVILTICIFTLYTQYLALIRIFDSTLTNNLLTEVNTPHFIYQQAPNPNQFVENFGLVNFAIRDANSFLLNPYPESVSKTEIITKILLEKTAPQKSKYSGIFKDKNLLLIEAESLVNFAIDPILTPTLYKLSKEGIVINGYNSPLLAGSTSDSEFMANTSLLPSFDGNITFEKYSSNEYPQTLANVFKENGYLSIAAHNNYGEYYNRSVMLPHLGYTFYDAIGLEAIDNALDSTILNHLKWMMYDSGKVFAFWITFNSHQPYDLVGLEHEYIKYYDEVNKIYPELPEGEKVYFAKTMDFDRGLKQLLIDYKNSNVLNDFVIVIYGDHFPKGILSDDSNYQSICNGNGYSEDQCKQTPFIIYQSQSSPEIFNRISSTLDISPTLFDLFGLSYNYHLALGKSVFDPSNTGFQFNVWDVLTTDKYTYDPGRDSVVGNWEISESETLEMAHKLYYEYQSLKSIVPQNYFESQTFLENKVLNR